MATRTRYEKSHDLFDSMKKNVSETFKIEVEKTGYIENQPNDGVPSQIGEISFSSSDFTTTYIDSGKYYICNNDITITADEGVIKKVINANVTNQLKFGYEGNTSFFYLFIFKVPVIF